MKRKTQKKEMGMNLSQKLMKSVPHRHTKKHSSVGWGDFLGFIQRKERPILLLSSAMKDELEGTCHGNNAFAQQEERSDFAFGERKKEKLYFIVESKNKIQEYSFPQTQKKTKNKIEERKKKKETF